MVASLVHYFITFGTYTDKNNIAPVIQVYTRVMRIIIPNLFLMSFLCLYILKKTSKTSKADITIVYDLMQGYNVEPTRVYLKHQETRQDDQIP